MSRPTPWPNRVLREPLVHFLVLGAAVYLGHAWVVPTSDRDGSNRITVTSGDVDWLANTWEARWDRPPTPAERRNLIEDYVRETILYREALAMGLDRDDTIVRRRMVQKLEFVTQDLLAPEAPDDAVLAAWYAENRERYREPAVLSFTQMFVDPERRGETVRTDAEALLEELRRDDVAADRLGDPFLLPRRFVRRTATEVDRTFGRGFGASLLGLPLGDWHGPIVSGYGLHLVRVDERVDARDRPLDEVRERVRADWEVERREELNEGFYRRLRERYEVVIEEPEPTGVARASSGDPAEALR